MTALAALNKDTGTDVWKCDGAPSRFGTPVATKIKDVDVIITPNGDFVRAADGKLLARTPPKMNYNAPIVSDGVAYLIQNEGDQPGRAIKLPDEPADELKPQELWITKPKAERYYGSPLLHEGSIYAIMQQGVLSAIDATTGTVIYEKQLDTKSMVYSSLTLAGKYVYATGEGGVTVVFEAGREYKEVKRNELGDSFRSCPLFVGNRMYIRAKTNLYCIGK